MGLRGTLFSVFTLCFCAFFTPDSHAQAISEQVKSLDKSNVTSFIEDTSILTTSQNIDYNEQDISDYLDRHISKKARFKTSITFNMPGLPGQEKVLTLKKEDYIQQVKEGADAVDHYHSDIEIKNIKISKNKKTASLNTISTESGLMQVPQEGGRIEDVPIEGRSECFQVLKLGKDGYIQMHSANCVTVMNFLSH